MSRKVYIGGTVTLRKNGLPMKYTQVAYLQSSGTQFINSNFYPSGKSLRVVIKFKYTASHDGLSLFGNATNDQFAITVYGSKPVFYVGTSNAVSCGSQTSLDTTYTLDVTANNGTLTATWNGTKYTASYSGSLRTDRPMFIFGSNNGNIAETGNGYRLEYIKFYDNGTLVRDYIPCVDHDAVGGLYDLVEGKFYGNAGTGSFSVGTEVTTETYEVNNVAKEVKQIYVGVDNKARRVRQGYIGIGGVARPFLSDKELVYYGAVTSLSYGAFPAATSIGNYALVSSGTPRNNKVYNRTVDAYNTSLTKTNTTQLSVARIKLGATSVGRYALFGGGDTDNIANLKVVDAYDASLTRTTPTPLSNNSGESPGATSIGKYALFSISMDGIVNAYDESLTRTIPTSMTGTSDFRYIKAASNASYALFGGSGNKGDSTAVNAYDTSLTRTNPTGLNVTRSHLGATSVNGYVIFAGGMSGGRSTDATDAYDLSLTKANIATLSVDRYSPSSTTIDDFAIFAGGEKNGVGVIATVDYYDKALTKNISTPLSVARSNAVGVTVGRYALICGGSSDGDSEVEAYTVN